MKKIGRTLVPLGILLFFPVIFLMQVCVPTADDHAEARSIIEKSGVRGGLIVHLGCGDGMLTAALRVNERYLVQGLDGDSGKVERARETVHRADRYGQVSIGRLTGERLPYADNLVNLIVAENPGSVPKTELLRVLCPLGVLLTKQDGTWSKEVKPWPEDMDEWTHHYHGADNNPVAHDNHVGIPRHLRWIDGPVWARHHNETPSVSAFVSSQGRVFYIVDETPTGFTSGPETWTLVARDAFNGALLWKEHVPDWGLSAWTPVKMGGYYGRFEHPVLVKRLVAGGDMVYATLGYNAPVTALDAATGKKLWTCPEKGYADELAFSNGVLFVTSYAQKQQPLEEKEDPGQDKSVRAYDTKSGKELWVSKQYAGINPKADHLAGLRHLFMTVGKTHVFVVDGDQVVALDRDSGEEDWRTTMPTRETLDFGFGYNVKGLCKLVAADKTLLAVQMAPGGFREGKLLYGTNRSQMWDAPMHTILQAYDTEDGKILWTLPAGVWGQYSLPELFVFDDLVWIYARAGMKVMGLDLRTGEKKKERSIEDAFSNQHHHRCYGNRATERYLITSYRGLEYLPWDSEATDHDHWIRGTCQLGVFPCNGLTYAPPHPCDCYITSKLNGLLAVGTAGSTQENEGDPAYVLQKGSAYSKVRLPEGNPTDPADWPMYRHDASRSGNTQLSLPGELKKTWQTDLKEGGLTAPVVAGGLVFVASKETHLVYALDALSGKILWRHTAGGPVDSPPTVYGELVLFGSRDGWVTCLCSTDGLMVWRFRAAPKDQLICAYGKLESSWPVHGSILVKDGSVCVVAGRSSFLDEGFVTYRLDPLSGEILERGFVRGEQGKKTDWGRYPDVDYGVLSDILVEYGPRVFMRQRCLFGPEFDGPLWSGPLSSWAGYLDDSWFNRTGFTLEGIAYGSLVVYNEQAVFSIRTNDQAMGPHSLFDPGRGGYWLAATDRSPQPPPEGKKWISPISPYPQENLWKRNLPVRVTSMALTGSVLFGAGTRDVIDEEPDPWKTYRGEQGGVLMGFSLDKGDILFEAELKSAPVYDGMAVACDALLLSLRNGTVACYRGK